MKKQILFFSLTFILLFITFRLSAQLAINDNGSAPDGSAMLDVVSSNRGILLPCLTREQIRAIQSPANGLFLFCTTNNSFYVFHASNNVWREISYGSGRITQSSYCGYDFTDQRDEKTYHTVLIGNQCWMAQNLDIGIPIDGNMEQENNGIIEKYCYNDSEENCNTLGGLYQWNEMMQFAAIPGGQGICPAGWHIPTDAEWATLISDLGGEGVAGGKMKLTEGLERLVIFCEDVFSQISENKIKDTSKMLVDLSRKISN